MGKRENLLDASTPVGGNAARLEDATQGSAQLFRALKNIDFHCFFIDLNVKMLFFH